MKENLVCTRIEDGVVTFERMSTGETIDCEVTKVQNIEKFNVNDIIVSEVTENDGDVYICLLELNTNEMERVQKEIAPLVASLMRRMRKN